MFELQEQHGSCNIYIASVTVLDELIKVWEYAGYGDSQINFDGKLLPSLKDVSLLGMETSLISG